jgi:hypothetical protein
MTSVVGLARQFSLQHKWADSRVETTHFMWVERQFRPTTQVTKPGRAANSVEFYCSSSFAARHSLGDRASRVKLKEPPV